jgi:hypothetical protein
MHHGLRILAAAAALALAAAPAHARVTISSAATQNMSCSGGVCAPTATKAVLNVGDLESLLASGNVTVTTTGAGVQALNIHLLAPLSWATSGALTLDARRSVSVLQPVSILGLSGLTLTTHDGGKTGELSFRRRGNVTFANLQSSLVVNGAAYTLVGDIASLAGGIAANPRGNFALASEYDAKGDGTYTSSPISTTFYGNFDGLGNTISQLKIDTVQAGAVGFFGVVNGGQLRDIRIRGAHVTGRNKEAQQVGILLGDNYGGVIAHSFSSGLVRANGRFDSEVGGLVGSHGGYQGQATGVISNSYSSATVVGDSNTGRGYGSAGGLVGTAFDNSLIENSHASGTVTASVDFYAGGLVGNDEFEISDCYATGNVTVGAWGGDSGPPASAGGLVGYVFEATIENSYATGKVLGGSGTNVGGLFGVTLGSTITSVYSTGSPSGGSYVGGLVGYVNDNGYVTYFESSYWDTDTSGVTDLSQGAGNFADDPGITGLTTAQFQSGLPTGFDSAVWAENPAINGGLPYLIDNPPTK